MLPSEQQYVIKEEADLKRIIDKCIKKDMNSQEALYRNFYGYAMGICLRYSSNRFDARNILNEGFFKVFVNLEKYNPDRPFKAWLGRIMANTAIDHYRSELKFMHAVGLEEVEEQAEPDLLQQKLDYEELVLLVQQLPPSYRAVFNLFAIDGYTHEEIAAQLGISVGASKSNLFKARKRLQEFLKKTINENCRLEEMNRKDYYFNQASNE